MTGLTLKSAEYAKQRQYTVTFILERMMTSTMLQEAAIKRGIQNTKGGRLLSYDRHVSG